MTGLILIILAGLLWCANGIVFSYITRKSLNFVTVIGIQAFVGSVFVWFFISDFNSISITSDPRVKQLLAIMLSSGILGAFGMILMQKAMRTGHHGIVFTVSQSAMIIPFLFGILFFGAHVFPYQIAGLLLVVISFAAFGLGNQHGEISADGKKNQFWLLLTLFSFIILGVHQSLITLPSYWKEWTDVSNLRIFFLATGFSVGYLISMILTHNYPDKKAMLYGVATAPCGIPSLILFFRGLDMLATKNLVAFAYPLAVGTCIIGFITYSLFFLKERTPKMSLIGVFIGIIGLVIISIN